MFSFKSDGVSPIKPPSKYHGTYVPLRPFSGTCPYKNMEVVGLLPASENNNVRLYSRNESTYSTLYGVVGLQDLKELAGDKFAVVQSCKSNYYKTVSSWDNLPSYSYEGSESHAFGMEFFSFYYGPIMSDCIAPSEEICDYIDWTKSPGWPHTYFGFRSKNELVSVMADTLFSDRSETMPIWNVSGKIEFKSLDEIKDGKIRLFQVPCFELLYSQIKYGKRISLRLMSYKWSAYGFNPYGGGFDRLARQLMKKKYRGCYDVSGWDKFLPLLKDIYCVLRLKGDIPEAELEEFLWCVDNTCNFLLRLLNGQVIRKSYGNASGSGCTTRDNIFGHIIIFAAGLYNAYKVKTGFCPPFELVASQIINLYGDDNVYSVDEEFSLMCDESFLSEHLARYGLKLKFFFGGLDADLHTLSFLGASFKLVNNRWLPLYDVYRLATTMVYEADKLDLSQHLGKAFTLMVMSRPSDAFSTFYRAYGALITSELVRNNLENSTVRSYHTVGLPQVSSIDAFFNGSESENISDLVLFFSLDLFPF